MTTNSPKKGSNPVQRIAKWTVQRNTLFGVYIVMSNVGCFALGLFHLKAEMVTFAGFSAICMAFINLEQIAEFSALGFSLKRKEEPEAVVDGEDDADDQQESVAASPPTKEEKKKQILGAILHSRYQYRTLSGIAGTADLHRKEARDLLRELEEEGMVRVRYSENSGTKLWRVSRNGRASLR